MTERAWTTRLYQPGDETGIRELFATVFQKELSQQRWEWQYRDNHAEQITIMLAVSDDGKIVGQYALRPVRMKIGDREGLGTLSLDTMVHPEYRRQGMFTILARALYKRVSEEGVRLTYGFPNANSYRGFVSKLDWVDLCGRIPVYMKVLNVRNVLRTKVDNSALLSFATVAGKTSLELLDRIQGRARSVGEVKLEPLSQFDERVDDLWDRGREVSEVLVVRDREYLNWRYVENPEDEYDLFMVRDSAGEIAGYLVLKCDQRFGLDIGFIMDVLILPGRPDLSEAAMGRAVSYFREKEMDMVSCLMLETSSYADALETNGFRIVPENLLPQELHLGVLRHGDDLPASLVEQSENWFVSWGDHDAL